MVRWQGLFIVERHCSSKSFLPMNNNNKKKTKDCIRSKTVYCRSNNDRQIFFCVWWFAFQVTLARLIGFLLGKKNEEYKHAANGKERRENRRVSYNFGVWWLFELNLYVCTNVRNAYVSSSSRGTDSFIQYFICSLIFSIRFKSNLCSCAMWSEWVIILSYDKCTIFMIGRYKECRVIFSYGFYVLQRFSNGVSYRWSLLFVAECDWNDSVHVHTSKPVCAHTLGILEQFKSTWTKLRAREREREDRQCFTNFHMIDTKCVDRISQRSTLFVNRQYTVYDICCDGEQFSNHDSILNWIIHRCQDCRTFLFLFSTWHDWFCFRLPACKHKPHNFIVGFFFSLLLSGTFNFICSVFRWITCINVLYWPRLGFVCFFFFFFTYLNTFSSQVNAIKCFKYLTKKKRFKFYTV